MKNVVAYCRVSTDGQAGEERYGLDVQKEEIMNYCSANNMQISEWFVDEISGVKESRPALDRLLFGDVSNPPVEAVVVFKSDRISRDIKLYFYYMMLLQKKGIELISATEPLVDDDSGLGNVYRTIMLFVAEQERKNITKRTSGGRRIKASLGGYSGGRPPYGYAASKDHRLVVIDEEAEVVRSIFAMKDSGMTYQSIVDWLNEHGKKNKSGTKFSISTVQTILNNRKVYEGFYKYGKNGDWVSGQHEAILT